ncbi:UDP-glycosyltransferase 73E1-like [Dendrobium catenatum]|uniref:UDP-glycosyltransferase 73C4 n=1 Tax=Dendrobium catenatum TaxID=906689 RepID=A0A2I0XIQ5_9ASPA|nr:UDP-glycosyltransferase 73E1-like [Dendrobium catenatum]PKU87774.1 UDP-glycosyltransferase 73C4 [Dendrobium catenatum]
MSSEADDCNSNTERLHFLLVPLMAQGHMIPMIDLARLLVARGALVTFVTTPVNLARIQPIVDRAAAAALPIRFAELPFPATDVGLPDGCENCDLIPSVDLYLPFMKALSLLREPLEAYLCVPDPSWWPKPSCIISDNTQYWTADFARALEIPRLIFHGPSCFYLLCYHLIDRNRAELEAEMEAASGKPVLLPGLPQPIQIRKHEVVPVWRSNPAWFEFIEVIRMAGESADGVLINSFKELEPLYFERYHEVTGKAIWPVGPLSLYKEEFDAKATRGRASSIDQKLLFQWLDKQEDGSVVFISFGSIARNTKAQLVELGDGLEASGRPFVWAVKEASDRRVSGLDEWIAEFEEKVEGRGIVIRGWAPQTVILEHRAVGGFVTHCGWNSTLEAVAAGVVMATWPHFADQFLNEQLVVNVLKIGVAVGVEEPTAVAVEDNKEEVVKVRREQVEKALEALMAGGEEGEERRVRVRELREKARMAMEEGGSSWEGLKGVINYVKQAEKEKEKDKSKKPAVQ